MKVLVCGGRDFADTKLMEFALDQFHAGPRGPIAMIIHGGARGADTMAGEWSLKRNIPYQVFLANWLEEGRPAGPLRNKRMLDEGMPDLVVAFPGGRGTANMMKQSRVVMPTILRDGCGAVYSLSLRAS